jgi:Sulfotransferase family
MTFSHANRDEALIFLHIPKTGGTTFSRVLERQYRLAQSFWSDMDRPSFQRFAKLRESERAKIRFAYGHLAFGFHELLPRPARYMTLLRDPVERAISHYYFICRTPRHPFYREVTNRRMSLCDYIDSPISNQLVNGQAWQIAGGCLNPDDPALLETAKANILGHFALVGLMESFDETLLIAKEIFGWSGPLRYVRQNVTRRRPSLDDISKNAVNLIHERNRVDMQLYQFARKRLETEIDRRGCQFQQQVRSFRDDNFPRLPMRLKALVPRGALRPFLQLSQLIIRRF